MNFRLPLAGQAATARALNAPDERTQPLPALAPADAQALMQIGDLAREAGKTVRAIHLYEELGLLTPAARSKGRYRLYGPEALVRIRWIAKLQEMGFSLSDLQTIVREFAQVANLESAPSAMKRLRDVYASKLEEAREQKRRIEALEHDLELSLKYLDTCGDVCDTKRLVDACGCCDLHDKEADVPELVLGFRAEATVFSGGSAAAPPHAPQPGGPLSSWNRSTNGRSTR
jgi:MerR family copper efflux transcriptional regulator